jgi:hypothetical protein
MPIAMEITQTVVKKKVVIVAMLMPLVLLCKALANHVKNFFNANQIIV